MDIILNYLLDLLFGATGLGTCYLFFKLGAYVGEHHSGSSFELYLEVKQKVKSLIKNFKNKE